VADTRTHTPTVTRDEDRFNLDQPVEKVKPTKIGPPDRTLRFDGALFQRAATSSLAIPFDES